jgi:hypothetical protein
MTGQAPASAPARGSAANRSRGCAPWLVGCGVALLIVVVVGSAAAWWFIGRPVQQIARAAQEVGRIQTLDARVSDRSAYQPPADGELSEAQVRRYVAVLRRIEGDLEAEVLILEARYAEIDGRRPTWTDIPRLAGAYADFLRLLVRAKEAQVEALNAERFSLEQYAWVRREVLRAAGLPGVGYDVSAFVDAVTAEGALAPAAEPAPVPARNAALVEAVREELEEVAFLALLGL